MNQKNECTTQGRHCGDPTCTRFHGAPRLAPKPPYEAPGLATITDAELKTALEADVFHEVARSLTPELAILLKALAYGATLAVESGTFGFRAKLRAGQREAGATDLQLSACIMGLAAAWERS